MSSLRWHHTAETAAIYMSCGTAPLVCYLLKQHYVHELQWHALKQ